MKKRRHIGIWVLAAVVLLLGIAAFLQRENIKAAVQGLSSSPEELQQKLEENQARIQTAVQENPALAVRELTEEEKKAFREGSLTREELIRRLIQPESDEEMKENPEQGDFSEEKESIAEPTAELPAQPDEAARQTQTPVETLPEEKVPSSAESEGSAPEDAQLRQAQIDLSALVAEVYVLQEEYNTALQAMVEQAKQEYAGKTAAERTKTELVKWASGYVSRATELEKECDVKMDEIAAKMVSLIRKNKGDDSIVRVITVSYAEEKSLKKAWYLSEMQNRGLLG